MTNRLPDDDDAEILAELRRKYRPTNDGPGQRFYDAYERLSLVGKCDGPGGAEYRRVLAQWRAMGCPDGIDQFIVAAANEWPDAHGTFRGREQNN